MSPSFGRKDVSLLLASEWWWTNLFCLSYYWKPCNYHWILCPIRVRFTTVSVKAEVFVMNDTSHCFLCSLEWYHHCISVFEWYHYCFLWWYRPCVSVFEGYRHCVSVHLDDIITVSLCSNYVITGSLCSNDIITGSLCSNDIITVFCVHLNDIITIFSVHSLLCSLRISGVYKASIKY